MKKRKKLSLKQAYYRTFAGLIVLPLLIVLAVSLLILKKYKEQAVENIESVQKTVAAGLLSDADFMSMRLSQITNVNNNMIMQYAVDLDNGNDADSSKE